MTLSEQSEVKTLCNTLFGRRAKWITGSLSRVDTGFLLQCAIQAKTNLAVELGTASGFSAVILCHALELSARTRSTPGDFRVVSYDSSSQVYFDASRAVGAAAWEQLPLELLEHITFRHPARAADLRQYHSPGEVQFLFVDASHRHPWPALDLLACLECLQTGATIVLHDINLPLRHPEVSHWGAKYLFDALDVEKVVPATTELPNIGSFTLPLDKDAFAHQLREIISTYQWEDTKVSLDYLHQLGVRQSFRPAVL